MSAATPNQVLDQQLEILGQLQTLLAQEKDAITARDADKIIALSELKADQVQQLQSNDATLAELLKTSALDSDGEAKKQQITQLLEACKKDNDVNGHAIQLSLASLSRLQHEISTHLGGNSGTYDQSGKAISGKTMGTNFKA